MSDEAINPSRLLDDAEREQIVTIGLDPAKFTVLPLRGNVLRSDPVDGGGRVVVVAAQVQDGIFNDAGTRLHVVGRQKEWLSGRAPFIPEFRLVIAQEALTPEALVFLSEQVPVERELPGQEPSAVLDLTTNT